MIGLTADSKLLIKPASVQSFDHEIMLQTNNMRSLLASLILLFFSADVAFAAWDAKVVDLYDGDTLILSVGGRAKIIQLFGVDCPEKEQPFGLPALDYSRSIVSGKNVSIITVDEKRYPKCRVYVGDECLNEVLLKAGYAWLDDRNSLDEKWKKILKKAMVHEKGLWSQEEPVPPWEFREGEEEKQNAERRGCTIKLGGKHKRGTVPTYRPPTRRRRR
jgi:endonuclease YncB( thermonuclease family)